MVKLDTYVHVNWNKCQRCYKCVELCTETYKEMGLLGYLIIDEYDGTPEYAGDNPRCHHCDADIEGIEKNEYKETPYACNKICPTGAMEISRW